MDVTTQAKVMAEHPAWGSSLICITASFMPGSVSLSAHSFTVAGFEWGCKNKNTWVSSPGFNPNMSERVQLLLSDHILGMTLVPERRVWNYGSGSTQLWSSNISYNMILDTSLLFWAEEHRPTTCLAVSFKKHLILFHYVAHFHKSALLLLGLGCTLTVGNRSIPNMTPSNIYLVKNELCRLPNTRTGAQLSNGLGQSLF